MSAIMIEPMARTEPFAFVDAIRAARLRDLLAATGAPFIPMFDRGYATAFCKTCNTAHGLQSMTLCQYCFQPACAADTVVAKRAARLSPVVHVGYTVRGVLCTQSMTVASCLDCFAHCCWTQNVAFAHDRLPTRAPSFYIKKWLAVSPFLGAHQTDACATVNSLLGAYETLQRRNSDLQERVGMLERSLAEQTSQSIAASLDGMLYDYTEDIELKGFAKHYARLDRCNGYDLFPGPCSSPALRDQSPVNSR